LPDHLKFFQGHFVFQRDRVGYFHGRPQGGERAISPLEIGTKNQKFRKSEVNILIPINWFNSCNNTLFTGMALTLHKSQLHCSGVMQWCTSSLLMSTLFHCCYLLRDNNMATNLQRFTSSYNSLTRVSACACRPQICLAGDVARQW